MIERDGVINMDSKNFAIGVLSTTAMVLLVGLIVIQSRPTPVRAHGMTAQGGDYVMTVGALDQRDEDLIYIIDAPAEKMIAYRFDARTKRIEIVQGADLAQMRSAAAPPKKKPPSRGRSSRRRP